MAEQGAMTPNKRRCTEAPVRTTSSGSLALIDQNVHPSLAASFSNDAKPKASFMTGINPNNPASPGTPSGSMASLVKPAATSLSGGFSSFAASKTGASIFGGTALKPSGLSHDAKTNTDGSSFKLESRKPSNAGHSAFGHTFGVNPKATGEPTMRPSPADPGSSDIKPETEPQDKLTPPSTKNVDW
ncbi:uncharacterized protein BO97DRAFT_59385 [Aspergillus homomorphus CBS 101889]|uniref:Uncharacterized protein n=1 Tax=Aspergillus homomorphus (strain CBS 101889) TaxID=1450537 RepID=A0A395HXL7_ASPHC|nr:hypothetical protein BO97DRAFT_59385 [Aspergillus homomorphus CBS 101889]RAL12547.1 hypothetical protein BO97DRAFT_59385 [Aspergillus homomorphus CBS 101889]